MQIKMKKTNPKPQENISFGLSAFSKLGCPGESSTHSSYLCCDFLCCSSAWQWQVILLCQVAPVSSQFQ